MFEKGTLITLGLFAVILFFLWLLGDADLHRYSGSRGR